MFGGDWSVCVHISTCTRVSSFVFLSIQWVTDSSRPAEPNTSVDNMIHKTLKMMNVPALSFPKHWQLS